jgi:hypothetical protein
MGAGHKRSQATQVAFNGNMLLSHKHCEAISRNLPLLYRLEVLMILQLGLNRRQVKLNLLEQLLGIRHNDTS